MPWKGMLPRATIALSLLTLWSCAPKAVVVEPLAPTVAKIAEHSRATVVTASKVSTGTKELQKQSTDLQAEIVKNMIEVERKRRAGLATQEDADAWKSVHLKSQFLEAALKPLVLDASELEAATKRTAQDTTNLSVKVVEHDKSVEALKTQVVEQADDASTGRLVKRFLWIAVIAVCLYFLAKMILPLIKPL